MTALRDAVGRAKILHASGRLRELALAWWGKNMRSVDHVTQIAIKGDGFLRFEWDDGKESGSFHLPLERIYATSAPPSATAREDEKGE